MDSMCHLGHRTQQEPRGGEAHGREPTATAATRAAVLGLRRAGGRVAAAAGGDHSLLWRGGGQAFLWESGATAAVACGLSPAEGFRPGHRELLGEVGYVLARGALPWGFGGLFVFACRPERDLPGDRWRHARELDAMDGACGAGAGDAFLAGGARRIQVRAHGSHGEVATHA